MQPKSSKGLETLAWFEKALKDIESAKILFAANSPTQWHQVLFFCQQAVEKTMKAFLVWNETKFRWTHDLLELGKQCVDIEAVLTIEVELVKYLTDYAWEFRYPGEDPEPTKSEAKDAIAAAERFRRAMLRKLPSDTHPMGNGVTKRQKERSQSKKKR